MNKKALIITFLSLAALTACTQTKEVTGPVLTFEEMDSDSSGYISSKEANANKNIAQHFKKIDSNSDGKINITEFMSYIGKDRMTPPEDMETPEPGAAPY